jgi:peptidoglycan-N-acetylglucosamine deacetylase
LKTGRYTPLHSSQRSRMSYTLIFSCIAFIWFSCNSYDKYRYTKQAQPAICLSFDDYPVDAWFELRDLFLKYDVHVTFFVAKFDTLSPQQIEKLKVLQNDGHEIGFHGANHLLSEYYIKDHSLKEYIEKEIVAGINTMNDSGSYPTSFAYPFSAKYWGTDKELLKYFYVVRSEALNTKNSNITEIEDAYYKFDGSRILNALSIDRRNKVDASSLRNAITRIVNKKEVLMLYAHEPNTTFDVALLESLFKEANKRQVRFITISDLVK